MPTMTDKKRELTGRHVALMLLAFFGVVFAVNAYFIFVGVTSFRGEDVKGSYRQGLEYNQTLTSRTRQAELGWAVSANFNPGISGQGDIIIQFRDVDDLPINELIIEANLRHPTDLSQDRVIKLEPRGNGQYIGRTDVPTGQWGLRAIAYRGDQTFRFKYNIRVP